MSEQNNNTSTENTNSVQRLKSMFESNSKTSAKPAETLHSSKSTILPEKRSTNASWIKNKPEPTDEDELKRRSTAEAKQNVVVENTSFDVKNAIKKFSKANTKEVVEDSE